jgi:hypothetical protein
MVQNVSLAHKKPPFVLSMIESFIPARGNPLNLQAIAVKALAIIRGNSYIADPAHQTKALTI